MSPKGTEGRTRVGKRNKRGKTETGSEAKQPERNVERDPTARTICHHKLRVELCGSYRHHRGVPERLLDDTLVRGPRGELALLPGVVLRAMRDATMAWAFHVVAGDLTGARARLLAQRIHGILGGGVEARLFAIRMLVANGGNTRAECATAIDVVSGTAKDRTLRTLETGAVVAFESPPFAAELDELDRVLLAAAAKYTRRVGKDKYRGYGRVKTISWGCDTGQCSRTIDCDRFDRVRRIIDALLVADSPSTSTVVQGSANSVDSVEMAECRLDIRCLEPVLIPAGVFGIYHPTRDYIPGRVLAGVLLPLLDEIPEAEEWYRDGTLQFRHAYPVLGETGDGVRGVPAPPFCVPKNWDGGTLPGVFLEPTGERPKDLRHGYVAITENAWRVADVELTERVTGGGGVVVAREGIREGTRLRAVVRGPKQAIERLKVISIQHVYIGAAKRGSMGLCVVDGKEKTATEAPHGFQPGCNESWLAVNSLAVVRGDDGSFTADPQRIIRELATGAGLSPEAIELKAQHLGRGGRDDAYHAAARRMRPTLVGVPAGSLLRIVVRRSEDQVKVLAAVENGIGAFRGEGFGELELLPNPISRSLKREKLVRDGARAAGTLLPPLPCDPNRPKSRALPEPRWVRLTELTCTFRVTDPVHVGDGPDTSNTLRLQRGFDGTVEIRGASFKGALRRLSQEFGTSEDSAVRLQSARDALFPKTATVGEDGSESLLAVDWGGWVAAPASYVTRPGIALSRATGAVEDGALYNREFIPIGATFKMVLTVYVGYRERHKQPADVEQLVHAMVEVMGKHGLEVGHRGGHALLTGEPTTRCVLWSGKWGAERTMPLTWCPKRIDIELPWTAPGGVLIAAQRPDAADKKNEIGEYKELRLDKEGASAGDKPTIPRNAWKGALRARAEHFARTATEYTLALSALDLLFGPWREGAESASERRLHRGALTFHDTTHKRGGGVSTVIAIDHLTGAALTGALAVRVDGPVTEPTPLRVSLDVRRLEALAKQFYGEETDKRSVEAVVSRSLQLLRCLLDYKSAGTGGAGTKAGSPPPLLDAVQTLLGAPPKLDGHLLPLAVGGGTTRGLGRIQFGAAIVSAPTMTFAAKQGQSDPSRVDEVNTTHSTESQPGPTPEGAECDRPPPVLAAWREDDHGKLWGVHLRGTRRIELLTDRAQIQRALTSPWDLWMEIRLISHTTEILWVRGESELWVTTDASPVQGGEASAPPVLDCWVTEIQEADGVPDHGVRSYFASDEYGNATLQSERLVPPSANECSEVTRVRRTSMRIAVTTEASTSTPPEQGVVAKSPGTAVATLFGSAKESAARSWTRRVAIASVVAITLLLALGAFLLNR